MIRTREDQLLLIDSCAVGADCLHVAGHTPSVATPTRDGAGFHLSCRYCSACVLVYLDCPFTTIKTILHIHPCSHWSYVDESGKQAHP